MIFKCKRCGQRYWSKSKAKDCQAADYILKKEILKQRLENLLLDTHKSRWPDETYPKKDA